MKSARILFSSLLIGPFSWWVVQPRFGHDANRYRLVKLSPLRTGLTARSVCRCRRCASYPWRLPIRNCCTRSVPEPRWSGGTVSQTIRRKLSRVQDIGGSMGQYDYEAIAALEPDLVLAAEINTPEQVRSLESLGLTVYYLSNPIDFDGLYGNISLVGKLSGHDQESTELVSTLSGRVKKLEMKLAGVTTRPSVYYELDATDPALPYTIGTGTFGDYLITRAGGTNLGGLIGAGWVQISAEEILQRNPDLILLGDVYLGVNPETVAARPGWGVLDAVKNGKVIPFNDDLMSRPTARLIDGLEALAALTSPGNLSITKGSG